MDCVDGMKFISCNKIDLTITSPPYDNLRKYDGYNWDFKAVANELYRITNIGGIVVWIINDATINGSETLTSFKQALYFKEIGFNIHDTMIWDKGGYTAVGSLKVRYAPVFEYMFILSKGKPKTFNPIKDKPNKWAGTKNHGTARQKDGSTKPTTSHVQISEYSQRYNIWNINPCKQKGKNLHPAPFPEQLVYDHIISWSNEGDIILDPFMGSGTTAKMCIQTNRYYLGFEISQQYCKLAEGKIGQLKLITQ